jgi:hypothetical protein
MKLGELALMFGLVVCCAVLPVLLTGGIGAVTGILLGSPALLGFGLVLMLFGLGLWSRRPKAREPLDGEGERGPGR